MIKKWLRHLECNNSISCSIKEIELGELNCAFCERTKKLEFYTEKANLECELSDMNMSLLKFTKERDGILIKCNRCGREYVFDYSEDSWRYIECPTIWCEFEREYSDFVLLEMFDEDGNSFKTPDSTIDCSQDDIEFVKVRCKECDNIHILRYDNIYCPTCIGYELFTPLKFDALNNLCKVRCHICNKISEVPATDIEDEYFKCVHCQEKVLNKIFIKNNNPTWINDRNAFSFFDSQKEQLYKILDLDSNINVDKIYYTYVKQHVLYLQYNYNATMFGYIIVFQDSIFDELNIEYQEFENNFELFKKIDKFTCNNGFQITNKNFINFADSWEMYINAISANQKFLLDKNLSQVMSINSVLKGNVLQKCNALSAKGYSEYANHIQKQFDTHTCPNCGTLNTKDSSKCVICGKTKK